MLIIFLIGLPQALADPTFTQNEKTISFDFDQLVQKFMELLFGKENPGLKNIETTKMVLDTNNNSRLNVASKIITLENDYPGWYCYGSQNSDFFNSQGERKLSYYCPEGCNQETGMCTNLTDYIDHTCSSSSDCDSDEYCFTESYYPWCVPQEEEIPPVECSTDWYCSDEFTEEQTDTHCNVINVNYCPFGCSDTTGRCNATGSCERGFVCTTSMDSTFKDSECNELVQRRCNNGCDDSTGQCIGASNTCYSNSDCDQGKECFEGPSYNSCVPMENASCSPGWYCNSFGDHSIQLNSSCETTDYNFCDYRCNQSTGLCNETREQCETGRMCTSDNTSAFVNDSCELVGGGETRLCRDGCDYASGRCVEEFIDNSEDEDWFTFCTESNKCERGEGDCSTDETCEEGLLCLHNIGLDFGYPDERIDVCVSYEDYEQYYPQDFDNHDSVYLGEADYCTRDNKCYNEEGDCDTDFDCMSGLECIQNVGEEYGFSSTTDVCLPREDDYPDNPNEDVYVNFQDLETDPITVEIANGQLNDSFFDRFTTSRKLSRSELKEKGLDGQARCHEFYDYQNGRYRVVCEDDFYVIVSRREVTKSFTNATCLPEKIRENKYDHMKLFIYSNPDIPEYPAIGYSNENFRLHVGRYDKSNGDHCGFFYESHTNACLTVCDEYEITPRALVVTYAPIDIPDEAINRVLDRTGFRYDWPTDYIVIVPDAIVTGSTQAVGVLYLNYTITHLLSCIFSFGLVCPAA